jgi:hypothetical protein
MNLFLESAIVADLKGVFALLIFACLRSVSCMPNVASFSGLSIYHCCMLSYFVYDILKIPVNIEKNDWVSY